MNLGVYRCGNCGHEEPKTEDLKFLKFQWMGPLTSKVSCRACGSYTLQRAYDDTFTRGEFLLVKTKIKHYGRG